MNDPNYVIIENYQGKFAKKKKFKEIFSTSPKEEENQKNLEIIQGRKGKTIKQKREPGKKGILKNEQENGKKFTEAEYVVEVIKPLPFKSKAYKTDESRPGDDDWKLEIQKNHLKKKRNHVQRQCNL
jgi:hypothetical protein